MNDETKKENAVEQRPGGTLIGWQAEALTNSCHLISSVNTAQGAPRGGLDGLSARASALLPVSRTNETRSFVSPLAIRWNAKSRFAERGAESRGVTKPTIQAKCFLSVGSGEDGSRL